MFLRSLRRLVCRHRSPRVEMRLGVLHRVCPCGWVDAVFAGDPRPAPGVVPYLVSKAKASKRLAAKTDSERRKLAATRSIPAPARPRAKGKPLGAVVGRWGGKAINQ